MKDDFSRLRGMEYSGRGITLGMTAEGNPFVGYTLTGRSLSSQARKLVYDKEKMIVKTDVTDLEQLKKGNPALLIYPAIIFIEGKIIAGNGVQTNLIADFVRMNKEENPRFILIKGLKNRFYEGDIDITSYEPDAPNLTPRISGCLNQTNLGFYVIRRVEPPFNALDLDAEIIHSSFSLEPGKAKFVTTYHGGNENPLLSFSSEPLEAIVSSVNPDGIVDSLYEAIGPKNGNNYRVAAAVMMMNNGRVNVSLRNRFELGN